VRAFLDGELPGGLPHRGEVIVFRTGAEGAALVLGEADLEEPARDVLEALLVVAEVVHRAETGGSTADIVEPALPRNRPDPAEFRRTLHDLRNLLTAIDTGLADPGLAVREPRFDRECQRAGELLLGALDLPPTGPAPLMPALRDVCSSEAAACSREGIVLETVLDPEAEAWWTRLSENAVERLARNLLVNARQAIARRTPRPGAPAGRIEVRLRLERGPPASLTFEVADDGAGWPSEPSRGLPPARGLGATGIGLESSRTLVEAAGGSLEVEPAPEGGALFRIVLPAHSVPL